MSTVVALEHSGKKFNRHGEELVECEICGYHTAMTGTKRCDQCWEIERHFLNTPTRVRKIMEFLNFK